MLTPNPQKPRILIVDDDPAQGRALANTLGDQGYDTTCFTQGTVALAALQERRFELLLADMNMPEINGLTLLQGAQKTDPDLVCVIMTGEGTIATAVEAMKSGALDYILKPFKLSAILPVLARALAVRALRIEVAELERSVRERTVELEAANKELEAFSYSVSHDLRSPLTVIIGGMDLLIGSYSAALPHKARTLLDETLQSALHMTQLIDDLLRLSRLGREPLTKQQVDVVALIRGVLDELQKVNNGRCVDVRLGDLPNTLGDPTLLRQVFANLLSNAYKFTRTKETPVVEIGCRRQGDENVYFVRDNGAGFASRRAGELFCAFHRLHTADQFEGAGVGLTIAHRIVTRHGGRIWAEAEIDQGATFYVGLPA